MKELEHLDVSFCELAEDEIRAISEIPNLKLLRMKGEFPLEAHQAIKARSELSCVCRNSMRVAESPEQLGFPQVADVVELVASGD